MSPSSDIFKTRAESGQPRPAEPSRPRRRSRPVASARTAGGNRMGEQEGKGGAVDLVLGLVVLVLLILVVWLYVFAMPKYGEQFGDLGVELPHLTVVLLNASVWIRVNWLFLALILIMGGGSVIALGGGPARTTFLIIVALVLALLLVAGLGSVYLPAQRPSAIMTPAPGAGP